jgi:hypothetical protein
VLDDPSVKGVGWLKSKNGEEMWRTVDPRIKALWRDKE